MTIRRRHGPSRGQGSALLELMIALVIASAAMVIAAQLLEQAQRQAAFDTLEALELPIQVALAQLRGDVYAAGLATDERGSRRYPGLLRLEGGPAGFVEYELVGTDLVRRVADGERPVVRNVFEWTWVEMEPRQRRPQILIGFSYRRLWRSTFGRPGQSFEKRQEWLFLTLRGGGSSSW